MADDAIKKAAKKIRDAYKTGRPIKPVRETLPRTTSMRRTRCSRPTPTSGSSRAAA